MRYISYSSMPAWYALQALPPVCSPSPSCRVLITSGFAVSALTCMTSGRCRPYHAVVMAVPSATTGAIILTSIASPTVRSTSWSAITGTIILPSIASPTVRSTYWSAITGVINLPSIAFPALPSIWFISFSFVSSPLCWLRSASILTRTNAYHQRHVSSMPNK